MRMQLKLCSFRPFSTSVSMNAGHLSNECVGCFYSCRLSITYKYKAVLEYSHYKPCTLTATEYIMFSELYLFSTIYIDMICMKINNQRWYQPWRICPCHPCVKRLTFPCMLHLMGNSCAHNKRTTCSGHTQSSAILLWLLISSVLIQA